MYLLMTDHYEFEFDIRLTTQTETMCTCMYLFSKIEAMILNSSIYMTQLNTAKNHRFSPNPILRTKYGILGRNKQSDNCELDIRIHNTLQLTNKKYLDEIYYQHSFTDTGKNPKKFDIPSGCTMDELKDLIKQVASRGIPPYGIHETQTYTKIKNEESKYKINKKTPHLSTK
ncbi:hypothetical protein GmHk_08G023363 [Glycine max]|nr:hypothetical protein GmHk_08G023363 [Glycine max]